VSDFAAFMLLCAVFVVCDAWHYHHGNDSAFWGYKTPEEKVLQQGIIEKRIKK
jgi:hypothetical protein